MQQRSIFVTVVAWIFIALSGFGTIIAILQNIMVFTLFRSPAASLAMQTPPTDMPVAAAFVISHFHLFFVGFLVISVVTLVISVGLLRRWNWARLGFIGIMVLGIIWSLGGLVFQFSMFSSMRQEFSAAIVQGGPDMQPFLIAIAAVSVLFAAGFCVLYGWIVKRLISPVVAAEFGRRAPMPHSG